ncbi:glycerol-3-phosphate 1-O-acyltransferase PlsY [Alkalibaculum sp. M08DMB]|uniref:Glycerol-3-phosphate acyltransferase n=1 Tax=Alkalibaculum sporogenes TaxID=2655001 RepID=A0A6A7KDP2_9FIRM|nr:glycerol-3-phosphate 1-O-acyltransferase PlsY [Alkalibaculum sporogenes]MPW27267.1 glycerol-3-phosphate 1-O-acyltransferase PlsY [Alkalibaculum sporogenes]
MKDFIILLVCYLIGNISFSYVLTKIKLKKDIREFGSGNAGTTNVLRVLGRKYAILVLVGDVLKGIIAIILGKLLASSEMYIILCGLLVIIGHNWPALMGFRGGKGIATSIGVFVTYDPIVAFICIGIGVLIIVISKYVSLGSVIGMSIFPIVVVMLSRSFEAFIFACCVSAISIYKHRANISRLIKGTENKLKF